MNKYMYSNTFLTLLKTWSWFSWYFLDAHAFLLFAAGVTLGAIETRSQLHCETRIGHDMDHKIVSIFGL